MWSKHKRHRDWLLTAILFDVLNFSFWHIGTLRADYSVVFQIIGFVKSYSFDNLVVELLILIDMAAILFHVFAELLRRDGVFPKYVVVCTFNTVAVAVDMGA